MPEKPIVKHPRYENPIPGYEKRLVADTSKQHATDAVYAFIDEYVDTLSRCLRCKRRFYFFAEEQKYWYEDLGFWIEAKCYHCPECRIKNHKVKKLQKEYELLQKLAAPQSGEIKRFRVVARSLLKLGCIKDRKKLDKFGPYPSD
tara:strand:+ start:643 stop:1077 length:435 start_codon:yes stop_codon:yes gene_type:complete